MEVPATRLRVLTQWSTDNPESYRSLTKAAVKSGLAIVLCEPGGKEPICTEPKSRRYRNNPKHPEGGCGRNHAITDPELAHRAYEHAQEQYPDQILNIGVHAGKSRLAYVDVDNPKQMQAFITAAGKQNGQSLNVALNVSSPGKQNDDGKWAHYGGGHFYFDATGIELPTDAGKYSDPNGGWVMLWGNEHVVAPPSVRKEGPYTFSNPEVPPLPQWLVDIAWNKVKNRNEHSGPGEPTEIDEWAARIDWSKLLKPEHGWIDLGRRDSCGCPIYWVQGRSDKKSATAHEVGCAEPRVDTSTGHGPLHLWTTEPPEFLQSKGENFTKLQYLALAEHCGSIAGALQAVGINPATASDEDFTFNPAPDGANKEDRPRMYINGREFLSSIKPDDPPIWGGGDVHLWSPGESLMFVGPPGVGKSTMAHLVVFGRLGLFQQAVSWGVTEGQGKVLYLAMDRPKQIARAMQRLMTEEKYWDALENRLVVHQGPLPVDICDPKMTGYIKAYADSVGADTVVVDSVKDLLPDPSDEKRAGLYNLARQSALAAGVEWVELHHNRKSNGQNKAPNKLDDVYGSRWLTAGAGSVLSLFGDPGDVVLDLRQLKTPAGELFPKKILLNKDKGQIELFQETTVEMLLITAGRAGLSPKKAAEVLHSTTGPTASNVEAVRRKLKRLVSNGKAEEFTDPDGGQMFRNPRLL